MSFTRESKIIIGICLIDLAVTLVLLRGANVAEGNPLMNYYLQRGVGAFVVAKLCLLFLPIFIAEWCRQYSPVFVKRMLRLAIVAYVGSYGLLFLRLNVPVLLAREISPAEWQQPVAQTAMLQHPSAPSVNAR